MLMMGRRFRGLGKQNAYRLLRWTPMSAADFVSEWFESEPLRAAIAAGGIFGTALGPRSAGSTAVLLLRMSAGDGRRQLVRGGLGAFTAALAAAARAAGVEIRVDADVDRINVRNGHATGVTLRSGEELSAKAVVSNADPRRTMLGLVDPVALEPGYLSRMRSYRAEGRVMKINLALSALPDFTASLRGYAGAGRLHPHRSRSPLPGTRVRCVEVRQLVAAAAPRYYDSITDRSGAGAARRHVMSIAAQFAPYRLRGADWTTAGPAFADTVIDTLARYAPDLKALILGRQVITPVDLEKTYGLTGGHIFHGELSLDQLFTMRPLLGWARYRTPIHGLYLCGAGTHPGYGVSGLSGLNAAREILKDLR